MSEEILNDEDEFSFAEAPVFDIDYKGDCAYEVKVTVPVANEVEQSKEMLQEIKQDAEIPGFRRGKAPVKLVERKFSKAVKKEVVGKLVSESFQKLVTDEDLKPIGYPDIDGLDDDADRKADEPMNFTFKFEVQPRVELGKYRGLKIERPVVKIDEEDIMEAVDNTLKQHANYVETDDAAEENDQVIMDFKGTVDGEEFSGGSAENYPYVLGSNRFFPEFEEALAGSKAGDEQMVDVSFPDDYFEEILQGKTAQFSISTNEVKRLTVPEFTDDFAKEAGFEGTDDLRSKLEAQLRESSSAQSARIAESRALDAVIEDSTFEMSAGMVDSVAQNYKQQEYKNLGQAQISPDEMKARMESIEENAEAEAIKSIRAMVTLNEIGEAEGIEVIEEDFEKEAGVMAKSMGMEDQVEMVAQFMAEGDQRSTYADRIYRAKAMAVVIDSATITDKELTREEMDEAENDKSAE
jgi:trigger factor